MSRTADPAAERLALRIDGVRRLAISRSLRAVVLCSAPRHLGGGTQSLGNTRFFLGYAPMGGSVVLVVPAIGPATVLAAGFNEARMLAQRVGNAIRVRTAGVGGFEAALARTLEDYGIAPDEPIGIAGLSDLQGRIGQAISASLSDLTGLEAAVAELRCVGDAIDVALHRRAAEISDAMIACAFELACEREMTPARLMAEVEATGRRLGADSAKLWLAVGATPPVTCFEFFELPDRISAGDRIQLGTTVSYEGHYAQGLRMAVRGKPDTKLLEISDRLLEMQDRALATMSVGQPVHRLADALEALIDASCPYDAAADPFRFQACHQLGLDYSEPWLAGALAPGRDRGVDTNGPRWQAGMVVEVHPNFSLPGLGHVCAGDMALVTEEGPAWLTRYPRGLKVLPV